MRESCSCGAAIQVRSYKKVLVWRLTHRHGETEIHELDSETSFPTGFTIEADEDDEEEC
jgi:hypothetical protein